MEAQAPAQAELTSSVRVSFRCAASHDPEIHLGQVQFMRWSSGVETVVISKARRLSRDRAPDKRRKGLIVMIADRKSNALATVEAFRPSSESRTIFQHIKEETVEFSCRTCGIPIRYRRGKIIGMARSALNRHERVVHLGPAGQRNSRRPKAG